MVEPGDTSGTTALRYGRLTTFWPIRNSHSLGRKSPHRLRGDLVGFESHCSSREEVLRILGMLASHKLDGP